MIAWLALCARKHCSDTPPSPLARASPGSSHAIVAAIAAVRVLVNCAENITDDDINALSRQRARARPFADSRHAGTRPCKMKLVTFVGQRLFVSDTPSTLGLLDIGTVGKSAMTETQLKQWS
jgi:hypothetical protein